jgi:hypothetical protein
MMIPGHIQSRIVQSGGVAGVVVTLGLLAWQIVGSAPPAVVASPTPPAVGHTHQPAPSSSPAPLPYTPRPSPTAPPLIAVSFRHSTRTPC